MKKKIEIEIPEGKVAEWQEINGVTTLVMVDEVDNRPVTERIKTFEDARKEVGRLAEGGNEVLANLLCDYESNAGNILTKSTLAYMKLCIIAAALNDGWEPQFKKEEYRWYPWFYIYTQEEIDNMDEEKKKSLWLFGGGSGDLANGGIACADSYAAGLASGANRSARLAVKSESLAKYFGQQFIDIWSDYVALPRKEDDLLRREENTSKH